jgi:plastocyanin
MHKMKKTVLAIVFLLSISLIAVSLATVKAQTQVSIYAGEISTSQYGFGDSASSIKSPGPTLNFNPGENVTLTLHNSGTMAHNFAIVSDKSNPTTVLWGAVVDSSSNPVQPGSTGSVTFTVGSAGNYYYVCQVDGHAALGMWGNVVVSGSTVPEFPTPLLLVFGAMAITAFAAYFGKARAH